MELKFTCADDTLLPSYAKDGDAGFDLRARLDHPIHLYKGHRVTVPTGVAIELPKGFVGLVCPRSGLAKKHGLTVTNSPGVVDSGYRGEVCAILQMHGDDPVTINPGDRIAQLIVMPVVHANLVRSESLGESERGANGFGSTGKA